MRCPVCGSKALGRITNKLYYCWDCCVEWTVSSSGYEIYTLLEDGTMEPTPLELARQHIIDASES